MWPFTRRNKLDAALLDADLMHYISERQRRLTMRIMQKTLAEQAEAEHARAKALAHMKEE